MEISHKNLTIVGTSHIARQSVQEVQSVIERIKPDFVALELDVNRFNSLKTKEKRDVSFTIIKEIGLGGYLLLQIGHLIETKLGANIGAELGGEMIQAADIASKRGYKIALIDQEIKKTLKKFSRYFNWKEKLKLIWDILFGFVKQEKIAIDLSKVPGNDFIVTVLEKVKTRYPGLYKALVQDRNVYMARRLIKLMDSGTIVAVVGAGHVEGILEEIKRIENNKNKIDRI